MEWREIGNQVAKVAPLLGGLLGGPVGMAAGKIAATFLGTDPTPEAVMEKLSADPEALVRLREAEMTHKKDLEALRIQEMQLEVQAEIDHRKIDTADIQDARARDESLKLSGHHNYRADIMLAMAFSSLCFVVFLLFYYREGLGPEILTIMNMSVGMLLKMLSDSFSFEFGSSRGSKEKDIKLNYRD